MSPADRKILKAARGRHDDMDRAIDAVRSGGDPKARDEYNLPAFTWCARKGHIRVAQVLKAAGADIEARDNCERTALHHAVLFNRFSFIEYLLSIQADLSATEFTGRTALDLAIIQSEMPGTNPTIITRLAAAKQH